LDTFKNQILTRLPTKQDSLAVFSFFVFFIYTWALYRMAWYLPSWLYSLNLGNILIILAYVLAYCLFESLAMMAFLLFLSIIIPTRFFGERFMAQGSSVAALVSIGAVFAQRKIGLIYNLDHMVLILFSVAIPLLFLLLIFSSYLIFNKFRILANWVNALAERMTVFAFVYVPLSIIGLVVVLVRNLF